MKKIRKQLLKKYSILFFALPLFTQSNTANAQITRDTVIQTWNSLGYDFYPVQISQSETKYYMQDTLNNTFTLFNLDFTPFLENVSVPESFDPFSKNMEVIYISRTLFDCDSSNIEYAFTAIGTGFHPFYIMRTDGTQLFKLDSALAPYDFGALNGSQDVRPIINSSSGAKLFLYYPKNTNNLNIFSLCGKLPPGFYSRTNEVFQNGYVKIIPNPSSGLITFQIEMINNINDRDLLIFDSDNKEIIREKIKSVNNKLTIDMARYSAGSYYYIISIKGKKYHSGKFIISK